MAHIHMIQNMTLETNRMPCAWSIFRLGAGIILTCILAVTMILLNTMGHGVDSPREIASTPLTVFQWPILIMLASLPWRKVRFIAKFAVCTYYIWLLYYILFPGFIINDFEISRAHRQGTIYVMWAFSFVLIQCLIWAPRCKSK